MYNHQHQTKNILEYSIQTILTYPLLPHTLFVISVVYINHQVNEFKPDDDDIGLLFSWTESVGGFLLIGRNFLFGAFQISNKRNNEDIFEYLKETNVYIYNKIKSMQDKIINYSGILSQHY